MQFGIQIKQISNSMTVSVRNKGGGGGGGGRGGGAVALPNMGVWGHCPQKILNLTVQICSFLP